MVYIEDGVSPSHSTAELSEQDKQPYALTPAQKAMVKLSTSPLSSTQLTMRLNQPIDAKFMRLLKSAELEDALVSGGYLVYGKGIDGRISKTPTPKGTKCGVRQKQYKLAGGGFAEQNLYDEAMQKEILAHLNALLGGDAALDAVPVPKTAPSSTTKTTPQKNTAQSTSHFRFCWNCEGKIVSYFTFDCAVCGWPICPKCGACRTVRMGGCVESKKGLSRFTGLLGEKNKLRTMLQNNHLLDKSMFDELRKVESPAELDAFRRHYAEAFDHIETIRREKADQRAQADLEKLKELKRNQRGFYKILSVNPRFLTYITATGAKKTIPNRPPIRIGSEYADLSGIPESER